MSLYAGAADWGTVPDWVAAVGSVMAFLGFGAAFWWEIHKRRKDEAQMAKDRRLADAERRDAEANQARLITASVGFGYNDRDYWTASIVIKNDSDGPIFDVSASLAVPRGGFGVPPLRNRGRKMQTKGAIQRLGRADSQQLKLEVLRAFDRPDGLDRNPGRHLAQVYAVRLEFTDLHGRRWQRIGGDQPERVVSEPDFVLADPKTGRYGILQVKSPPLRSMDRWIEEA